MLKVLYVKIQRFRSIMDMHFEVNSRNNLVAFCGQNNVGKTNVLRAINVFFNPDHYNQQTDIPTLKNATWGGSVHPKIEITFFDNKNNIYYCIIRDFKPNKDDLFSLSGFKYKGSSKRKLGKENIKPKDLESILNKFSFIYIESINTVIPNLINGISQDVLTLQFDKTRFSNNKKALKEAYDTYVDGLQEILNVFSNDISSTFKNFKENWKVAFHVPKSSDRFRDLISDDVSLQIEDNGSKGIDDKGSGLQRLAHILMEFEAADRIISKKDVIICIDEPDIYLHEGLQKKLKSFIDEKTKKMQVFYTTHSKIFIDTYKLENTVLLSCKYFEQFVTRKNKIIDVIETLKIDIDTEEGYEKICDHLGIEKDNYEVLEKHNILVEGMSDKKYIEELARFFNIECKNIIPANGANNIEKYLDFYNSYYKNNSVYKPKIKIILDNDNKGREVYKKVSSKNYQYLDTVFVLQDNFKGDANKQLEKNNTNNEIEDLLYPELICHLMNVVLNKKGLVSLDEKTVCSQCNKKSFSANGILSICEHIKNDKNPDNGNDIVFTSSSNSTNNIKESMAGLMKIEGNKKLISLIEECDKKYPHVRKTLKNILEF